MSIFIDLNCLDRPYLTDGWVGSAYFECAAVCVVSAGRGEVGVVFGNSPVTTSSKKHFAVGKKQFVTFLSLFFTTPRFFLNPLQKKFYLILIFSF